MENLQSVQIMAELWKTIAKTFIYIMWFLIKNMSQEQRARCFKIESFNLRGIVALCDHLSNC